MRERFIVEIYPPLEPGSASISSSYLFNKDFVVPIMTLRYLLLLCDYWLCSYDKFGGYVSDLADLILYFRFCRNNKILVFATNTIFEMFYSASYVSKSGYLFTVKISFNMWVFLIIIVLLIRNVRT